MSTAPGSAWIRFRSMVWILAALTPGALIATPGQAAESESTPRPLLVLLTETGETRDGLPVLVEHTDAPPEVAAGLSRGLSGTLLRVYRMEQTYLQMKQGTHAEPAYVLLSPRQGGFGREGFFLGDVDKRHAGYVDVKHDWPLTGDFGALDQIVPHELFHVIRRQLAGPIVEGNTNQVHAVGVKTDRVTAFNEGFAEHFQTLAIEHDDADPATAALAADRGRYAAVQARLGRYAREVSASVAITTRLRMGFVAWYSNDEDVLRYFAIKENAFAREPGLPERVLSRRDPYSAYLLENILLGQPDGAPKSVARMVSTEGVVATLSYRWATDDRLRNAYRDDAFYEQFGVDGTEVEPLENLYLKWFDVLYEYKPQGILDVIEGYRLRFPDEAPYLDAVVEQVFLGQPAVAPVEIWLANEHLQTGTSLFDQFRGLPRLHTFDLNAASMVDLIGVPGVDSGLARAIIDQGPFTGIDDLARVDGVTDELIAGFHDLSTEMDALLAETEDEDVETTLSISSILLPFVWRALAALAIASVMASLLYHWVRRVSDAEQPRRWRTVLNGFGAALVGLLAGWAMGSMGLASLIAVGGVFGLPAGAWCLLKTRQPLEALKVMAAWVAAALPSALLTTPWF